MSRPRDEAGAPRDVDVIVPCFNGARFLGDTLEWALSQTSAPRRVIVVDDGSTDDTRKVVAGFGARVRYHHQENRGQAAARNAGFALSDAPYVCFLDADDLLLPTALERLRARLEQDPSLDVAHGETLAFTRDPGRPVAEPWRPSVEWRDPVTPLSVLCAVDISSALFRRRSLERHGLFPEDRAVQGCEDWLLWLRGALGGMRIGRVPELALLYRQHVGSSSARPRPIAARESELMRRAAALFVEHGVVDRRRWAALDVGLRFVALRWLALGESAEYRALLALASSLPAHARDPELERAFQNAGPAEAHALHLHLASRMIALDEPALAMVMLVRAGNARALHREAGASRSAAERLTRVTERLSSWARDEAARRPPRWVQTPAGSVPQHASSLGELECMLGHLALERGEDAEARERFERALALDPCSGWPRVGLAACLRRRGRTADALRELYPALRRHPRRVLRHLTEVDAEAPLIGPLVHRLRGDRRVRRAGDAVAHALARAASALREPG